MDLTLKTVLAGAVALAFGLDLSAKTIDVKVGDDLRTAIHEAASGDVVQVAAGTHTIANEVTVPAGVTVAGQDETTDLDGQPRVWGKRVDIGCYELQRGRGLLLIVR